MRNYTCTHSLTYSRRRMCRRQVDRGGRRRRRSYECLHVQGGAKGRHTGSESTLGSESRVVAIFYDKNNYFSVYCCWENESFDLKHINISISGC